MKTGCILFAIIAVAAVVLISEATYVVNEIEQVIITQFGRPVGDTVTKAGLHFKTPFIQKINRFDKRWLEQ